MISWRPESWEQSLLERVLNRLALPQLLKAMLEAGLGL